jgi:hypothetical protein
MIISTSGKMADITAFILVFTAVFSLGNSLPVERGILIMKHQCACGKKLSARI